MLVETKSQFAQVLEQLIGYGVELGKSIIVAILIYVVGRFVIKYVNKLVAKVLEKKDVEISVRTFFAAFYQYIIEYHIGFCHCCEIGRGNDKFCCNLGFCGVAIGMALSGNLSNFAGGLIILVFKPFKVGDYIDGMGVSGTVQEIQIFHTILLTPDNKVIYVPNGGLSGSAVINYSKKETRRVDFSFGIEYNEDFDKVKSVIESIINADERVLKDPAYTIELGALSASSVDITVRVWVKSSDYWSVFFYMNKTIYATFNKEGINFPFPQLTIHNN